MKHHLWNMCASIKNGQLAKKPSILQTRKKVCESILRVLWDEGFILGYRTLSLNDTKLEIFLKYNNSGQPVINSLNCISKPGKRIYLTSKQIWKIDSNKSFIIFSTNKGLKTIVQCKKLNIGGEPFLTIN